jgi:hypothetical protein
MRLPQDVVRDPDVREQRVNVRVAAEKRVETRFEPVAVAVAPGREFAAGDVPFFDDERRLAGVCEILGCGETGRAGPDDQDIGFRRCDQSTNSWGPATVGMSTGIRPAMMISS